MRNASLIHNLYDCASKCNFCADACLDEDNVQMMLKCIRLDRICAATCEATAKALSVKGAEQMARDLIQACSEICRQCAEECANHENEHCQECAKACRECAKACAGFAA